MSVEPARRPPVPAGKLATQPAPGSRTPEQIRDDIVDQRKELGSNVADLKARVRELTDWRRQVREHQTELMIGAAAVGTLAGAAVLLRHHGEDDD